MPADESGDPKQLMTVVEDLNETAAIEIAGARDRRLGSRGKTPALSGSVPRRRHPTMLRKDEGSFNLDQLWVVRGRLIALSLWLEPTIVLRNEGLGSYEVGRWEVDHRQSYVAVCHDVALALIFH